MNKLLLLLFLIPLSACTQTKIVKVPIALPCHSAKLPPAPHNYMYNLNQNSTAPEFANACIATIKEYKFGYNTCVNINNRGTYETR